VVEQEAGGLEQQRGEGLQHKGAMLHRYVRVQQHVRSEHSTEIYS